MFVGYWTLVSDPKPNKGARKVEKWCSKKLKQAEAKRYGVLKPQNYNFNQVLTRVILMHAKHYNSNEFNHGTWLHVPSGLSGLFTSMSKWMATVRSLNNQRESTVIGLQFVLVKSINRWAITGCATSSCFEQLHLKQLLQIVFTADVKIY